MNINRLTPEYINKKRYRSLAATRKKLYPRPGNSIVVACLYYIFRNLFVNTEPEAGTQTKLF